MSKSANELIGELTETISKLQDESAGLKTRKKYFENNLRIFRFEWWIALSYLFGGGLLGYALKGWGSTININESFQYFIPSIIVGGLIALVVYSGITFIIRNISLRILTNTENKLAKLGVTDPTEDLTNDKQFYTRLVQINFKYTEEYYAQTQEQAEKSFRLSAFASVSGLVVLIIGIFMMFNNNPNNDKTSSYVATTAGVLSEFIAAIFFYLYTQTIQKMSEYHKKLLMTQNINLALRIADKIDNEEIKIQTLQTLIDRLTTDINKYLAEDVK